MRHWKLAASCAVLLLGNVGSAYGGAGTVTTLVEPLSTNITYSANATSTSPALFTYVGYKVTIANAGGNTINNILFTGTTAVTDAGETATFSSAEGASCTADAAGTSISCSIGQLKAGVAFPTFVVFFRSPVQVINGVADNLGEDAVGFSGITFYAEQTGGVPQSTPTNSTVAWAAASVGLGTFNPDEVKSAVPKSGGIFFTGGQVATSSDTWTTTVSVPSRSIYTTAAIDESVSPITCAADLLTCSTTTLTIPGTFAKLIITLRRDASTIAKGAKIASAKIFYENPTTPDSRIVYPYQLLSCSDTTWGPLPQTGIPCLNRRTEYTKKNAPTPDWIGDWEFEIFALDNGRYFN